MSLAKWPKQQGFVLREWTIRGPSGEVIGWLMNEPRQKRKWFWRTVDGELGESESKRYAKFEVWDRAFQKAQVRRSHDEEAQELRR